MLFTYASRVRSPHDCALEGNEDSEVPMATLLTSASITTHALSILEKSFRLPRKLVPSYEVHDKRAKMYYPSMHRLSLRREMRRW